MGFLFFTVLVLWIMSFLEMLFMSGDVHIGPYVKEKHNIMTIILIMFEIFYIFG
jgi:hypothetical protein